MLTVDSSLLLSDVLLTFRCCECWSYICSGYAFTLCVVFLPNDIQHSTSLNLLSYDDTTIYSSNSNADILYAETNKELTKLDDWFRANKG